MAFSAFSSSSSSSLRFIFALALLVTLVGSATADLSPYFYKKTCPELLDIVKSVVHKAVAKQKRMGASLLRLHFHDCFVNGCDGSILLDDTPSFKGEQSAGPNKNSIRGLNVIDEIKSAVEKVCPGVVSCADILAIAARDGTVALGGPTWNVKLGRRDSKTASLQAANSGIPPPTSSLSNLVNMFKAVGLSTKDMVALSGSHTIGRARCVVFRDHIYKEPNIYASFARKRQANCPNKPGSGDNNLASLDVGSPTVFDNNYYKNLVAKKGLLHSDQQLYSGGGTDHLVVEYSKDASAFADDFAAAMIKMGDIKPLTGSKGEIRKKCGKPN